MSPKEIRSSPNSGVREFDIIWLQGLCKCNQVKMKSSQSRVDPDPYVWCLYKKILTHRENSHVMLAAENGGVQL